jgi:putative sigma-54 modulation protein
MRLQVKAHNGTINDTVRAYAEKRLAKLERRLHEETVVEVTLSREFNPSIRDDHSADAVVYTKGPNIVASESAETYEAAIDRLVDKLERQVERYRDKRTHEPRRTVQKNPPVPAPLEVPEAAEAPEGEPATGEGEAAA